MRLLVPSHLAVLAVATPMSPALPQGMPHCATPTAGLESASACEAVVAPLPVVIQVQWASDSLSMTRHDVESVILDALAGSLGTAVRGDSGWAWARRDGPHVWAGVDLRSGHEARVLVLYWRGEADATLTKLCESDATVTVPLGSTPALAGRISAHLRTFGRCVRSHDKRIALSRVLEPEPEPTPLRVVLLVAIPSALLVAVVVWRVFFHRPRPDFWQAAARYPDKAYDWFQDHDEWLVVDYGAEKQPRPEAGDYEGPFLLWVPKLGGRRVAVYGRHGAMQESQRAFLRTHALDVR